MSDMIAAGLAETIRAELTSAMEPGKDEGLHFHLGPVQLDVTLAISRAGEGDAGIRFGVVSFGAKRNLSDATTHHLSLQLQPVVRDASEQVRTTSSELKESVRTS